MLFVTPFTLPMTATAQQAGWGMLAEHVFAQRITPLAYNVDYDGDTRVLRVEFYHPEEYLDWWLKGIQIIELLFSDNFKPTQISAVYVNGSEVQDMLYVHPVYNDGNTFFYDDVQFWMEGESMYYDATYLLAFIHTFPNKTFSNLDNFIANFTLLYWDRPFIYGPNDTSGWNESMSAYQNDFTLAEDDFVISQTDTNVHVDIDFNEQPTTTTTDLPTETTSTDGTPSTTNQPTIVDELDWIVVFGSIGLVVMAIVIVVYFMRKQG